MQPPRVNTVDIQAVIRELTMGATVPAGAVVRRALKTRFGAPGGVARIYRILAEERRRLAPVSDPGSVEVLQRELERMRERAERAEAREEAHQARWAKEIDRLRMKVYDLESQSSHGRSRDNPELLRHQLRAAEHRIAELEQRLMHFMAAPGAGDDF